jgi:hypothetical protein
VIQSIQRKKEKENKKEHARVPRHKQDRNVTHENSDMEGVEPGYNHTSSLLATDQG